MDNMNAQKQAVRDYAAALKSLEKAEVVLDKKLDALDAALDETIPADLGRVRAEVEDAHRATEIDYGTVEHERRVYWRLRAAECEQRVRDICLPIFAELAAFQRFASLPSLPIDLAMRNYLDSVPEIDPSILQAAAVRIDPLHSPILDRAEAATWLPSLKTNYSRDGRLNTDSAKSPPGLRPR